MEAETGGRGFVTRDRRTSVVPPEILCLRGPHIAGGAARSSEALIVSAACRLCNVQAPKREISTASLKANLMLAIEAARAHGISHLMPVASVCCQAGSPGLPMPILATLHALAHAYMPEISTAAAALCLPVLVATLF